MSEQITLQVSSNVLQHAAQIAARTKQNVENLFTGTLESFYAEPPVESLSDQQVIALAKLKFTDEEQQLFNDLLYENREGLLTAEKREELDRMMKVYERGQLRKAQALEEAVKRGLLARLKS
ncbi:MAG: hypothetical protein ACRD82_14775 [Blastocatellia bacterium]